MLFQSVLVALDESPLSHKVLASAMRAVAPGGTLRALRVRPDAASLEGLTTIVHLDDIETETSELAKKILGSEAWASNRTPVQVEVRAGDVFGCIRDAAEEHQVELIVMGSHGRKNLGEMFTGSLAEQVVAKLPASVLVVKASGYPFLTD